jgi:formate dehydrogenase subunit gamma
MTELNVTVRQTVNDIIVRLQHQPGALLPILHGIQDALSYIPTEAVKMIADGLNLSSAEVHGVISFYHHFRTTAPGSHVIQICRAEACQSMGSRQLEAHAKQILGIDYHQTTADREISLEAVYCLGNCACAPSVRVGDEVFGRMSPDKFEQLVDKLTVHSLELPK